MCVCACAHAKNKHLPHPNYKKYYHTRYTTLENLEKMIDHGKRFSRVFFFADYYFDIWDEYNFSPTMIDTFGSYTLSETSTPIF